ESRYETETTPERLLGDPGSSTESVQALRLEQRMFLKAAFQLLEERERQPVGLSGIGDPAGSSRVSRSGTRRGPKALGIRTKAGGQGVGGGGNSGRAGSEPWGHWPTGERRRQKTGHSSIKSGQLRKARLHHVGRLETTTWKTKLVEVTPGQLAYYPDNPSVLGKG
ncbi:unnamed protein product, partial [Choristocarpus tenellus]